jgi:hypothetical protein
LPSLECLTKAIGKAKQPISARPSLDSVGWLTRLDRYRLEIPNAKYIEAVKVRRRSDFHLPLGEPWPKDLFPAIEERTKRLQAEYDRLLRLGGAV